MAAILIVDDNAVMSEALSEAARDLGHEVCVAPSGAAALALLDDHAVDAVLLDLRMPGMDGLTTTSASGHDTNGTRDRDEHD
jgi:CheY-like chemotaxis protein